MFIAKETLFLKKGREGYNAKTNFKEAHWIVETVTVCRLQYILNLDHSTLML